jgi:hypothetical protein
VTQSICIHAAVVTYFDDFVRFQYALEPVYQWVGYILVHIEQVDQEARRWGRSKLNQADLASASEIHSFDVEGNSRSAFKRLDHIAGKCCACHLRMLLLQASFYVSRMPLQKSLFGWFGKKKKQL